MINFRNKDEAFPSVLIAFSIVVLFGSLLALLFLKPPTVAGVATKRQRSIAALRREILALETRAKEAEASVGNRLWKGDGEAVTAAVLGQLTRQANQSGVQLTAFRPQKLQRLDGVAELPFSVQVTGSYPKVRALVAALDASTSKLVLRSFQFASTDGASNAVTATLGVSSYFLPPATLEVAPVKGGKRG